MQACYLEGWQSLPSSSLNLQPLCTYSGCAFLVCVQVTQSHNTYLYQLITRCHHWHGCLCTDIALPLLCLCKLRLYLCQVCLCHSIATVVFMSQCCQICLWQHCQFHIAVSQHCHCFTTKQTLPLCSHPWSHFVHIPTLPHVFTSKQTLPLCSHPNRHCHCSHPTLPRCSHPTLPLCSHPLIATVFTPPHCHCVHTPTLPLCSHPRIATVFTSRLVISIHIQTGIHIPNQPRCVRCLPALTAKVWCGCIPAPSLRGAAPAGCSPVGRSQMWLLGMREACGECEGGDRVHANYEYPPVLHAPFNLVAFPTGSLVLPSSRRCVGWHQWSVISCRFFCQFLVFNCALILLFYCLTFHFVSQL